MKRRDFIKTSGAVIGLSLMGKAHLRGQSPGIRPNLIFFYADQWRRMALSYYADKRFDGTYNQADPVRTPHFDRIAGEGMILHNAVTASPICSPNRATLMTGLYPGTHGLVRNRNYERFSHDYETIAHVLKRNGYETAHIGKWHLSMTEAENFLETPGSKRGFQYFYGSPEFNHGHFDAKLYHDKDEIDGRGEYTEFGKPLPNPFIPSLHYEELSLRKEESWNPNHLTRKALDYLKNTYNVRDVKKPFALYISFNPPHTIHGPKPLPGNEGSWHIAGTSQEKDTYGYIKNQQNHYEYRAPMKYEAMYRQGENHADPVRSDLRSRPNVPKDHYSRSQCLPGYYGAVNSIDDCFGQLETYLETTPDPRTPDKMLKETSIVIVTADHGEMLGSQGRMTKDIYYEESIGVPFIIRWPGHVKAGVEENMVFNSVHVAPSILGLLGLRFSQPVEGVDYSPVFLGRRHNRPDYAFIRRGNWRAVRSLDALYAVEFNKDGGVNSIQYFDLQEDPFQMKPIRIIPGDPIPAKNDKDRDRIEQLHGVLTTHLNSSQDSSFKLGPIKMTDKI